MLFILKMFLSFHKTIKQHNCFSSVDDDKNNNNNNEQ